MRGPSASRTTLGLASSKARSSSAKPPSGPISFGILVAEDQAAFAERIEGLRKRDRVRGLGDGQNAALLGGLDRIGLHALDIDPRRLGMARGHRLKPRGAEFHRLLHHVIEPRMFERREKVMQVAGRVLRPGLLGDGERDRLFALAHQVRAPFAIAPVEHQNRVARLQPQHVGQVIGLSLVQWNTDAAVKRGRDEQTRRAEIVAGHAPYRRTAAAAATFL